MMKTTTYTNKTIKLEGRQTHVEVKKTVEEFDTKKMVKRGFINFKPYLPTMPDEESLVYQAELLELYSDYQDTLIDVIQSRVNEKIQSITHETMQITGPQFLSDRGQNYMRFETFYSHPQDKENTIHSRNFIIPVSPELVAKQAQLVNEVDKLINKSQNAINAILSVDKD